MTAFSKITLGELGTVVTGRTPPFSQKHFFNGDIPFLTPTDIDDDSRFVRSGRSVSLEWDRQQSRISLPPNTVSVVCIGATIGKMCMTAVRSQSNQQINSIIIDESRFDPHYIFYRLRLMRDEFRARAAGAATPIINKSVFSGISIDVPSLAIQGRVASILGAYDDLIEVNRRRIAVLEEMARRLFEEWFVRLQFPGYESHAMIDTPDGPLPDGWRRVRADELIDFDPSTVLPRNGAKPFLSMAALRTDCSLIEPFEMREGKSGSKFANGDTLFARITPCLENGKTGLVRDLPGGVGFGSTEFIVMRGRVVGPAFTYLVARLAAFRENARKSMSGATGRQRARVETMRKFPLAAAPQAVLAHFEEVAWPLFLLSGQLGVANLKLGQSRDLLLPRLISGELAVAEAERALEAAE